MALAVATYFILSKEHVFKTLTGDFSTAMTDAAHSLPLVSLEKLTYLTVTTFETLRISYGITYPFIPSVL